MSSSKQVRWLKALAVAVFATLAIPLPGRAADRITGYFPPFKDFSISVRVMDEDKNPMEAGLAITSER